MVYDEIILSGGFGLGLREAASAIPEFIRAR